MPDNNNFLGRTVQLYVTGKCNMGCQHCGSPRDVPDMTLETFRRSVEWAQKNGVERIELFANDPLLHPNIEEIIDILDKSRLGYALLTVGDTPRDPEVKKKFLRIMEKIDKERGAFVFSVDFTEKTAQGILNSETEINSYAFKAKVFWGLALLLQKEKIPVRTNTVISIKNVDEVAPIIERVVKMGFAASFCFVQIRQPEFDELLSSGLTPELEQGFREYMSASNLLSKQEVDEIIIQARMIVTHGKLEDSSLFNTFRGKDYSESEIPLARLEQLREELLALKDKFSDKLLPSPDFIKEIGSRGFGCSKLLKKQSFPQMKIGNEGQIFFCCDLHDPCVSKYSVNDKWDDGRKKKFLKMIRTNPYIWVCLHFNPCDFSVNRVVYDASVGNKMNNEDIISLIIKKKLPLPDDILSKVRNFCRNNNPNFKVLGDNIPNILSKDWLDSSLGPVIGACRHTNITPEEWRTEMEGQCKRTVKAYLLEKMESWPEGKQKSKSVAALLIWRGALAYASSLAEFEIPMHHMQAKRDEETLEISTPMPLSKADENALREYDEIIIPDSMLASGMSNAFTISLLNDLGIPNEKIRLLCVVAAPEGVFHLLKRYPGIKIIAATLDSNLNENAYIIGPGLGDAGDKYFWQNAISNFDRDRFNDEQWEHLKNLLKVANE